VTPSEFKSQLAPLVAENRNQEAIAFVQAHLDAVRGRMTAEDRMLVADWMEGVELALEVEAADTDVRRIASA
jgi:hypothetical protein